MWSVGLLSFRSNIDFPKQDPEEGEENDDDEYAYVDLQKDVFRTQLLLLDYKQFKAARQIQRSFRGWNVRRTLKRQQRAAILIQRKWRKYLRKSNTINKLQNRTQSRVWTTFHTSSIKIQALFRGWWSRKYINNMIYLKTIQLNAVEDILHCVNFKLHSLKRADKLPGLMTFREADCIQKVEDLVSTLTYRFYNRYVGTKWVAAKAHMDKKRSEFVNSNLYTCVPYHGSDNINDCSAPPSNKPTKVYERREYDVTQNFISHKSFILDHKGKQHNKLQRRLRQEHAKRCRLFCKDLIYNIKRWSFDDKFKIDVPDDILERNMHEFILDIKVYLETMNYSENCHCLRDRKNRNPIAPSFSLQ